VGVVVMMAVVAFGSVASAEVISGGCDGNAFVLDMTVGICGRFRRGGGRGQRFRCVGAVGARTMPAETGIFVRAEMRTSAPVAWSVAAFSGVWRTISF
jgi:hypothetical protein